MATSLSSAVVIRRAEPIDFDGIWNIFHRVVARGEVVVVAGNFAVEITEVISPQLRLEAVR